MTSISDRRAGEQFAHDLADLICGMGVQARVNPRRGAYAVYIKSAEDIRRLLAKLGATRAVAEIEEARAVKHVKNQVNRRVNAELANQTRSAGAAQRQPRAYRGPR
ncbi:MAG: DNA-binding protein WhiA [Collinsella sp.]